MQGENRLTDFLDCGRVCVLVYGANRQKVSEMGEGKGGSANAREDEGRHPAVHALTRSLFIADSCRGPP